jgi:hypothetical protein
VRKLPPLEITCANLTCPTPERVVVLTGKARYAAQKRGYSYCSPECGKAAGIVLHVAARYPNGPKVLEVTCANPACGKAVALTGVARTNALKRGRGSTEGAP